MKKMLLAAAFTSAVFGLVGCAQQETKQATAAPMGDKAAYETAIAAAKADQRKAASVGGEWRDTGKVIKEAEEAAAKGDFAKAAKLAEKAAFEGRMGYEQALGQKNAGNPGYLYK